MATLDHLGGDQWRVRGYVGTNPLTGKPRRKSISFRAQNKSEAKRLKSKYEAQIEAERIALAEQSGTVGELVSDWLAISRRDRSPSTMLLRPHDGRAVCVVVRSDEPPTRHLRAERGVAMTTRVTIKDGNTGTSEVRDIDDDWLVITDGSYYLHNTVTYHNGTVLLTVKRRQDET